MKWNSNLIQTDILAVHAALLHTGEIILFTGNEFWGLEHKNHTYDHVRLFNCHTLALSTVPIPADMTDLFCCGHAFLGNGNLMIAGGTREVTDPDPNNPHRVHGHWIGERSTWLYEPSSKQFLHCASLNRNFDQVDNNQQLVDRTGGRWYPTLVTLPSGQILAIGGHPDKDDVRHSADLPEFFEWNSWCYVEGGSDSDINFDDPANPLEYPRLHVLTNGKVFSSTPFSADQVMSYELNIGWQAYPSLTPDNSDWRKNRNWNGQDNNDGYYQIYNKFNGTSVLLPLIVFDNLKARRAITETSTTCCDGLWSRYPKRAPPR